MKWFSTCWTSTNRWINRHRIRLVLSAAQRLRLKRNWLWTVAAINFARHASSHGRKHNQSVLSAKSTSLKFSLETFLGKRLAKMSRAKTFSMTLTANLGEETTVLNAEKISIGRKAYRMVEMICRKILTSTWSVKIAKVSQSTNGVLTLSKRSWKKKMDGYATSAWRMVMIFSAQFVKNVTIISVIKDHLSQTRNKILLTVTIVVTRQSTSAAWLKLNWSGSNSMKPSSAKIVVKRSQGNVKGTVNQSARLPEEWKLSLNNTKILV